MLHLLLTWRLPPPRRKQGGPPLLLRSLRRCYELLDEIAAEQSIMDDQRYDVFLHVYVSTPFGDRRLGFKRYQTKALKMSNEKIFVRIEPLFYE